jgi:hypothetical protein
VRDASAAARLSAPNDADSVNRLVAIAKKMPLQN